MAEDLTVTVVSDGHVARIGKDDRFHNARVVTIKVGRFGPYTQEFPAGAQSSDIINQWKLDMVRDVQSIL